MNPNPSHTARDARCRFCGRTREEHDPDERIDCSGGEGSRAIEAFITDRDVAVSDAE